MPVRRTIERAVAQDDDGIWREREISTVARFRCRVLSDRSRARLHQLGIGEDFEVAIDKDLELWVRKFGTDQSFRKDSDVVGVSLQILDNVTAGIPHELSYLSRPSSALLRWSCSCGAGSRGELEEHLAHQQADRHRQDAIDREMVQARLAAERVAARRENE